jgi:regulatory protein
MNCYDKAVQLLSRRPHFRRQLQAKLEQREYPREEIEATLERLADLGFLDERRCAEEFVELRLRRSPVGRRRLRGELLQRGADAELVEATLDRTLPADDLEPARVAAARWARGRSVDRAALARFLDRQGFSQRAILRLLDEAAAAAEAPMEELLFSEEP